MLLLLSKVFLNEYIIDKVSKVPDYRLGKNHICERIMNTLRVIAMAEGQDLADALVSGSEACLLHLRAVSQVVGKKIRVWDSAGSILGVFFDRKCDINSLHEKRNGSCNCKSISKSKCFLGNAYSDTDRQHGKINICLENLVGPIEDKCFTEVEIDRKDLSTGNFVELQYEHLGSGESGHWTAKGKEDLGSSGNNCLFDAICQQCVGFEPHTLRKLTADAIRNNKFVYEEVFTQFSGIGCFLLGGAKYDGRCADEAKVLLDNSQGTRGHNHVAVAHPRGHASYEGASGEIDSVENYSRTSTIDFPKSAWLSRTDQDSDMHRLMLGRDCQDGMRQLNSGETRVVLKLIPEFNIRMGLWALGQMISGPIAADMVTILLQHHEGKARERDADVQVFTCYPMSSRWRDQLNQLTFLKPLGLKRFLVDSDDDSTEINKKIKLDSDSE